MAAILIPESGYTSCIKINGNPILPPLITARRRIELQNYKKRAIDIEKQLKSHKDARLLIQRTKSEALKNNSHSPNSALEHLVSFSSEDSHILALGIPSISEKSKQRLPCKDYNTIVPSKKQKSPNLTCNIFDVSEYSDSGVVIFKQCNANKPGETERQLTAGAVELDLSDACKGPSLIQEKRNESSGLNESRTNSLNSNKTNEDKSLGSSPEAYENLKPKPRLLRSNSYTLESPSPVLLEHFKKQAEQDPNNSHTFTKHITSQRRSLDLGNCSHSPISFLSPKTDAKSPKNKSVLCPATNGHINENTIKSGPFIALEHIGPIVQNLAHKHFGVINEPQSPETNDNQNNTNGEKGNETFSLTCGEAAFQEVLGGMVENYSKDILQLLERHKKEQEIKLQSYDTFKQKLFDHNVHLNSSIGLVSPTNNITFEELQDIDFDPLSPSPRADTLEKQLKTEGSGCDEVKSFSCDSQAIVVLANSPTDTLNALNTSTPLLIDFESDSCDNEPLGHFDYNSTYSNSDPLHVLRGYDDYRRLVSDIQEIKSPNCSRELFPDSPEKRQRKLKEQWAATILTAAAKGYLVRRLKRTERVQNLIQTIQDALLCAMGLHMENSESIRPPDVELHRRLIQQVSAACFEFYEVFFNLTTKEQMALIAHDRQRQQEKLKRPKSTSSLKLDSSRSTPTSRKHSLTNMRQRKTLTPSFAA